MLKGHPPFLHPLNGAFKSFYSFRRRRNTPLSDEMAENEVSPSKDMPHPFLTSEKLSSMPALINGSFSRESDPLNMCSTIF